MPVLLPSSQVRKFCQQDVVEVPPAVIAGLPTHVHRGQPRARWRSWRASCRHTVRPVRLVLRLVAGKIRSYRQPVNTKPTGSPRCWPPRLCHGQSDAPCRKRHVVACAQNMALELVGSPATSATCDSPPLGRPRAPLSQSHARRVRAARRERSWLTTVKSLSRSPGPFVVRDSPDEGVVNGWHRSITERDTGRSVGVAAADGDLWIRGRDESACKPVEACRCRADSTRPPSPGRVSGPPGAACRPDGRACCSSGDRCPLPEVSESSDKPAWCRSG